jgi:hypothetical protein
VTAGACGVADAITLGGAGAAGGATTAGGTIAGRDGVAAGGVIGAAGGTTGFSAIGGTVTAGRGGVTTGGTAGDATGAAGLTTGGATTGFAATGGTAGRAIAGGGAAASLRCVIAFSTSPGREICDRSILVLISSSPRIGRAVLAVEDCASDEPRRCWRTFSASCSSRELECVFFSVTPTIGSTSRMALLLTSSSLARSLIRTLLIRPFLLRVVLGLHRSLTEFIFCIRTSLNKFRACHNYSVVSDSEPCAAPCPSVSAEADGASASEDVPGSSGAAS